MRRSRTTPFRPDRADQACQLVFQTPTQGRGGALVDRLTDELGLGDPGQLGRTPEAGLQLTIQPDALHLAPYRIT